MDTLLTINAGSSSIKFQLFEKNSDLSLLASGKVEEIGTHPLFSAHVQQNGQTTEQKLEDGAKHHVAFSAILEWIQKQSSEWTLTEAVHRVVHGGAHRPSPQLLTNKIYSELEELIPLAPLHQPHNLYAIKILQELMPDLKQYACYDTAFHETIPALNYEFAIPKEWRQMGVRRYGFHGLSYEWINKQIQKTYPEIASKRLIIAHLGNGASVTAIKDGHSTATSMGMTALDGVTMGTRAGSIDPGAVFYLMRHTGLSLDEVEKKFYTQSGLKGLSGLSNDVRLLEQSHTAESLFALDYFVQRVAQTIASLSVTIGGIDALVFTGGIGEKGQQIREKIIGLLNYFNIPQILVIPTNEERLMAEQVFALLNQKSQAA